MKWWRFFAVGLFLSLMQGCIFDKEQHLYEVKMKNGDVFYGQTQPKKDDTGFYRFYDVNKQQLILDGNLVLYITPVNFEK